MLRLDIHGKIQKNHIKKMEKGHNMTQSLIEYYRFMDLHHAIPAKKHIFLRTALAITACALLIVAELTSAATLTVQNNNDDGSGSLRQMILDASSGDTIVFDPSLSGTTITLSSYLVIIKDLIIDGDINNDEVPDVTLSGNNATRIFLFSSSQSRINSLEGLKIINSSGGPAIDHPIGNLTIRNCTLSGNSFIYSGAGINNKGSLSIINSTLTENSVGSSGQAASGGAIVNYGNLSISNSNLSHNSSTYQGGAIANIGTVNISNSTLSNNSNGAISNDNASLTISNSSLFENSSTRSGGAIWSMNSSVSLTNSTLSENSSTGGGAIYLRGSTLSVVGSTLSGNSTPSTGGAIDVSGIDNTTITITNSTLTGNSSGTHGGAIYSYSNENITNTTTITDSNLSLNVAGQSGGAIAIIGGRGSSTLSIINSTLSGNSSGSHPGSALFSMDGTLVITNSTISHNTALDGSAGLYIRGYYSSPSITLNNNIIANSINGNDCELGAGTATFILGNNLIENGSGGCIGTISADPRLGLLQNNGGDTLTHSLLYGSPAIDAGINADAVDSSSSPLITDQRGSGFSRKVDTVDLGAFEFHPCQSSTLILSNIDFDTQNYTLSSETGIQVSDSVNILNNADLNLEAPQTHITSDFHAQVGSYVHITAMDVTCTATATPVATVPDTNFVAKTSASYRNDSILSNTESSNPILAARYLTQANLPQALQQMLELANTEDIHSFYGDAYDSYIVFATTTALLMNDSNETHDIYLYHSSSEHLELISHNLEGASANGSSTQPRIDGAGRYIVYRSLADDLTSEDSNQVADIVLYQIDTGLTTLISLNADGSESLYPAQNPVIGGSTPLILYDRKDTSGYRQLFIFDELYSNLGAQAYHSETNYYDNHHPGISADGRYISYLQTWTEAEQQYCNITIDDQVNGKWVQIACPEVLMTHQVVATDFSTSGKLIIRYLTDKPVSKTAAPGQSQHELIINNQLFQSIAP